MGLGLRGAKALRDKLFLSEDSLALHWHGWWFLVFTLQSLCVPHTTGSVYIRLFICRHNL